MFQHVEHMLKIGGDSVCQAMTENNETLRGFREMGDHNKRRSSVNFGVKTFLPENICMKN